MGESVWVGESVCCILCKAVLQVIGPDVMELAESSQLCAGQDGVCEAAVYAVRQLFESSDCEAVLLIDAFNSLNQHTALRNVLHQCPALAMALYAIGILPQSSALYSGFDAIAGGSLSARHEWWDDFCSSGPMFGYDPSASKFCLVLKDESAALAPSIRGEMDIISLQKVIDI